jgi:hypothetical protein
VREGADKIAETFQRIGAMGPVGVGRFLASDSAEQQRITADAFVTVGEFIRVLKS